MRFRNGWCFAAGFLLLLAVAVCRGQDVTVISEDLTLDGSILLDKDKTVRVIGDAILRGGSIGNDESEVLTLALELQDSSRFEMSGGQVGVGIDGATAIVARDDSSVVIDGFIRITGVKYGIRGFDNARISFRDGRIVADSATSFDMHDNSSLEIEGGTIRAAIVATDAATVRLEGGVFGSLPIGELNLKGSSSSQILGGDFGALFDGLSTWAVNTSENSRLEVFGGVFESVPFVVSDASTVDLIGGQFPIEGELASLEVLNSAVVNVYGRELLSGDGILSGVFADGTPFAFTIGVKDAGRVNLHEIPEPGTGVLIIIAIASLALRSSRRRGRAVPGQFSL